MSSPSFSLTSFDDLVDAVEGNKSVNPPTSSIRIPHLLLLLSHHESHSVMPLFAPSSSQNEVPIIFSQTPGASKRRFRDVAARVIRVLRQYKTALKFIQEETGNENIPKQIDVDEIRQDISISNGPTRFFGFLRKCFFKCGATADGSDTTTLALLASLVRTLASFVLSGSSLGASALCQDGFSLMLDFFISFSSSRTDVEKNIHTSIIIDSSAAYILYCLQRTSNSEQDFTFSSQQSQMLLNFCLGNELAKENKQSGNANGDEGLSLLLPSNTSFLNVTAANNANNTKPSSSSTISFETLSLLTEWFRIQPSHAFTAISSFVSNNNNINDEEDVNENPSKGGFLISMLRNVIQKQLRNLSSSSKVNNNNNNFFAESCWKFVEAVLSGVFSEVDDDANANQSNNIAIFETIWECLVLEQNAYIHFHDSSALQQTFTRIVGRILPALPNSVDEENENNGILFNSSFLAGILHTAVSAKNNDLSQDFCNLVCEILENGSPFSSTASSSSSSNELYAQFKTCLELLLQAFDPQASPVFGPSQFCTQIQHHQPHRKRRNGKEHQRSTTTIINDSHSSISDHNNNNNNTNKMITKKLILMCSSVFWKQYDRYRSEELPRLMALEAKPEKEDNSQQRKSKRGGRNANNRNEEDELNNSPHESIGRSASQEAIDSALRRREFDLSQIISENNNCNNNSQISNDNNNLDELSPIRELENNNHVDDISSKKYLLVPSLILLESQCRLLLNAVSEVSASETRKLEEDDIFVNNNNNNHQESTSTSSIMMNLISLIDNISRGCLVFLGSFDVNSDHNVNRDSRLKFKVICKITALSLYSLLTCGRELSSATVSASGKKHRSTLTNVVALALEQSYLIVLQLTSSSSSSNSKKELNELNELEENEDGENIETSKNAQMPTVKDILCQMTEIAPLMISAATSVYALSQQRQNFSLLLSSADDFLNSLQQQASEVFTAEVMLDEARRFLEVQPLYKLQGSSFASSEMDDDDVEEEELADDALENHSRNNNINNNLSKIMVANSSLLSNSSYHYISLLKSPMRNKNAQHFFNARIIDSTTSFLLEKALLCEPNGCEFERDRLNLFNIMSIAAQHPQTLPETFSLCDKIMRRIMSSLQQHQPQNNNQNNNEHHHDSSTTVTLLMELLRFQFKRSFELSSIVVSKNQQLSSSANDGNNGIQEIIQELFLFDYETLLPLVCQLLAESQQQHFFASLVHAFAFLVCHVHEKDPRCLDSLCRKKKLLHGDLPKLIDFLKIVSATDETKKAIQMLMEKMKKYYSELEPNENIGEENPSREFESSFIILDLQTQIKADSISRKELEERSEILIAFYKTRNVNRDEEIQKSHHQPSKSSRGVVGTIRQLKEDDGDDDQEEEISPVRNQEDENSDKNIVPSPHTRPSTAAVISPLPKHAKIIVASTENGDEEKDDYNQKTPKHPQQNNNNSAILDEEYSLLRHETIQDQRKILRLERQELASEKQANDHLLRQIDGAIQKLQAMVDEHSAERYHSQKFGDRTRMLEEEQQLVASQRSKTKDTECRVLRSLLQKRSAALMELDSGLELQQSLQHPMRMLVFAVNHKCQLQEDEIAKLSAKVRKQEENSSTLRHRTDGVRLQEHDEMQRKLAAMEIELDHAKKQLTIYSSPQHIGVGNNTARGINNNNNTNNSRPATASPQRLSAIN